MLSEKAKSRAQQRFFGMVRAAQKGEMDNPSSEVLDAADSMKVDDVKKFAKTKHKGLPEKKKIKESFTPHKMIDPSTKKEYWADTYDKHLKYKKMGYVHEEKKPRNCGCGKDPCITYGKKKVEEELTGDMKTDLEKYRVPRGPGGNPIRIGDKVRSMKGDQPLGKLKVKYGADKVREYYKKNKAVDEGVVYKYKGER